MTPGREAGGAAVAQQVVARFLRLCEARRTAEADAMLAPGAVLEFPGGRTHTSVGEMAAAAAGRYTSVAKTITGWRSARLADGADLVVCSGTLSGADLAGAPFSGIRFVDVFEVTQGRIRSQRVWNDLAEAGVVPRPPAEGRGPS